MDDNERRRDDGDGREYGVAKRGGGNAGLVDGLGVLGYRSGSIHIVNKSDDVSYFVPLLASDYYNSFDIHLDTTFAAITSAVPFVES